MVMQRLCRRCMLISSPEPLRTVMLYERLGSDMRFGLDHHLMLFDAAFTRIGLLR
jgi:hypothetical protein